MIKIIIHRGMRTKNIIKQNIKMIRTQKVKIKPLKVIFLSIKKYKLLMMILQIVSNKIKLISKNLNRKSCHQSNNLMILKWIKYLWIKKYLWMSFNKGFSQNNNILKKESCKDKT